LLNVVADDWREEMAHRPTRLLDEIAETPTETT